jgi:hypothetical protein
MQSIKDCRRGGSVMAVTLVGHFFHSGDIESDEVIEFYGLVVAQVHEDVYLLQLYDWESKEPTVRVLQHLTTMIEGRWGFYPNQVRMEKAYDEYKIRMDLL